MTETTKISEARLDELIAGAEFRIKHGIAVARGMEDWLSALRELQALRQENEWISVQDRMPEYGSVVHVYCYEWGDELKLRFQDLAGYSYHGGFAVGCHQHDRDVVVTHWSPLRPAPPAPRTEEQP